MNKIKILTNYSGLGLYIPAVILQNHLKQSGRPVDILLLEGYYRKEKLDNIEKTVKMFQKNFKAALMAQKLINNIDRVFEEEKVEELLSQWQEEGITDFIVLSGFWMPVISRYIELAGKEQLNIDMLHVNSEISVSWHHYFKEPDLFRNIWLFNRQHESVPYQLPIKDREVTPFDSREHRFLIHGGGWGLGTYKNIIPNLIEQDFKLDIVVTDGVEEYMMAGGNRYFKIDPAWTAWSYEQDHRFPRQLEIRDGEEVPVECDRNTHFLYTILKHNLAIISKPGGGTLTDSLASATPVIFLDAYGPSEEKNAELWVQLGYGLTYKKWEESNFSIRLLKECHERLLKARQQVTFYEGEKICSQNPKSK